MPERIQLRRQKGYRKPRGAVNIARPTRWGNPFAVGATGVPDRATAVARFTTLLAMRAAGAVLPTLPDFPSADEIRRELAGRDLACWCPLPHVGEHDLCHGAVSRGCSPTTTRAC
ncbi:DUF4326 domain-containing protein [Actinomadura sp. KC06]|nr:DUF4326 domain-containing protein [Actinomadura sp. KC06]